MHEVLSTEIGLVATAPPDASVNLQAAASQQEAAQPERFLTAEDLALAGLIALSRQPDYRAPKVDANNRPHDPLTGKFISQNTFEALRRAVHERVAGQLAAATERRAAAAKNVQTLRLGDRGQRSFAASLLAQIGGPAPAAAQGDLFFYRQRRLRTPRKSQLEREAITRSVRKAT